jgi:hypothetical protein
MKVTELPKRKLKENPLMIVDKILDKYKNYPIPQDKIDSANEISNMENYEALKKENITKP